MQSKNVHGSSGWAALNALANRYCWTVFVVIFMTHLSFRDFGPIGAVVSAVFFTGLSLGINAMFKGKNEEEANKSSMVISFILAFFGLVVLGVLTYDPVSDYLGLSALNQ